MIHIPVMETERLAFRRPDARDVSVFENFYTSPRSQYAGGIVDRDGAWTILAQTIGHWALRGFGMNVVTHKATNETVGLIGHYYPSKWPEREVGWVLTDEKFEEQGFAFEAAKACIEYAFRELEWDTAVSYIHPDNARSIKLAERLGAILDQNATQPKPDVQVLVYRHNHEAVQ